MKLTEINIYPVKSTRRIALRESEVLARGLPWDRRWMLVDDQGGFITARKYPQLSVVRTSLGEADLELRAPGKPTLTVPLSPGSNNIRTVKIWRDEVQAVDAGEGAAEWFSAMLGTSCRLVQQTDALHRGVDPEYGQSQDQVSFADGFPMLLISEASLADLNGRLQRPVSMRRFRPNLVVDGDQPYGEDDWRRLRIGSVEFEGVKNCSRCIFTTIDPDTGVRDPDREPLQTLSTYRRRDAGGVYFGQNLIPRGGGRIGVGDRVEVLG